MRTTEPPVDLVCFSQLRWDFVYQRPQHLMRRAARARRVWFVEEPVFDGDAPRLQVLPCGRNLSVARPVVPAGLNADEVDAVVARLIGELAAANGIENPIAWYWTPMALPWAQALDPSVVVYDCMDELSAFRFAPPRMLEFERRLLNDANLVFTGGRSLYEAKRGRHPAVHLFPSAVDAAHFVAARGPIDEPREQAALGRPRIGWFGVIDERTDIELLAGVADLRPDWSFVLVGPVVKIDPAELPQRPNLMYVGPRPYDELPAWIAGWQVAMMPFARNEATRFISPTKTLEYLAAGRPVVSTSIADVVEPFERLGLARIADEPASFVAAIEAALGDDLRVVQAMADAYLSGRDWDSTWVEMAGLLERALGGRATAVAAAAATARAATTPAATARAATTPAATAPSARDRARPGVEVVADRVGGIPGASEPVLGGRLVTPRSGVAGGSAQTAANVAKWRS